MPLLALLVRHWRLIGIAAAVIGIGVALFVWRGEIREAAYNEIFRTQVESALAKRDAEIAGLKLIMAEQQAAIARQSEAQREILSRAERVRSGIDAAVRAAQDRPVGPLLGRVMDEMP